MSAAVLPPDMFSILQYLVTFLWDAYCLQLYCSTITNVAKFSCYLPSLSLNFHFYERNATAVLR